jgi:chitin-binding protein
MFARRTLAVATAAGAAMSVAPALFIAMTATPAAAHGALNNPVSRAAACAAPGSPHTQSAVCRAARAASGGNIDWPNLRLPNVQGRDREVVPDGKLCSAGKPGFAGLDLPRADWPTTRLSSGSRHTFKYAQTIPHSGTFRLYVTKNAYQPSRPLRWSDLEAQPFATVTDPPMRNESYTFRGKLPANKSGRHVIYTIWQNSSTPDTYYSCSDVVFTAASGGAAPAAPKPNVPAPAVPAPASEQPIPTPTLTPSAEPSPAQVAVSKASSSRSNSTPFVVGAAAAVVALLVTVLFAVVRRRRQV